jgi:hypothetical protein
MAPSYYDPASAEFAGPTAPGRIWLEAACARVGSCAHAQWLMSTAHLHSWQHLHRFVAEPPDLHYKQGPTHWLHWPGSIFQDNLERPKESPALCEGAGPGAG